MLCLVGLIRFLTCVIYLIIHLIVSWLWPLAICRIVITGNFANETCVINVPDLLVHLVASLFLFLLLVLVFFFLYPFFMSVIAAEVLLVKLYLYFDLSVCL